jgi:hypothetical protein
LTVEAVVLPFAVLADRAVGNTGTLKVETTLVGFAAADAFGESILLMADTGFYQHK